MKKFRKFVEVLRVRGPQDLMAYFGIIAIVLGGIWVRDSEIKAAKIDEFHLFSPSYKIYFDREPKVVGGEENPGLLVHSKFKNTGSVPFYAQVYVVPSVAFSVNGDYGIDRSPIIYNTSGTVINMGGEGNVNLTMNESEPLKVKYSCSYIFYKITPFFNEYYNSIFKGIDSEKFSLYHSIILSTNRNAPEGFPSKDLCEGSKLENLTRVIEYFVRQKNYLKAAKTIFAYNSTHSSDFQISWNDFPALSKIKSEFFKDEYKAPWYVFWRN